jgi:hypothetical protein
MFYYRYWFSIINNMENNEQQTTGCKKCKQKGPGLIQIGSIILGVYILSTAIYGTIVLVKDIISWFK